MLVAGSGVEPPEPSHGALLAMLLLGARRAAVRREPEDTVRLGAPTKEPHPQIWTPRFPSLECALLPATRKDSFPKDTWHLSEEPSYRNAHPAGNTQPTGAPDNFS